MYPKFDGKQQHNNSQRSGSQPMTPPCTSPWTEPYQVSFAEDHQRAADDQDCQQPTLDALSHIYNRGYA